MLNIKDMNASVENALAGVRASIQAEFGRYFDQLISNDLLVLPEKKLGASLHEITDTNSLKDIPNVPGLYVIFSSYKVKGAQSRLALADGSLAIYRGEGRFVRRRVESHLFKEAHEQLHVERAQKNSSEQRYGVCMKVDEEGESGINVDRPPYSHSRWAVLVIRLPHSFSDVRKQAEFAFDVRFGTPAASRERPKKAKTGTKSRAIV